jgi:hypothetical protein
MPIPSPNFYSLLQRERVPFFDRLADLRLQLLDVSLAGSSAALPCHASPVLLQAGEPIVQFFGGQLGGERKLPRAGSWLADQIADLETRGSRSQDQVIVSEPGCLDIFTTFASQVASTYSPLSRARSTRTRRDSRKMAWRRGIVQFSGEKQSK